MNDTEPFPLRTSCKHCGSTAGYILPNNGQSVVRCSTCDTYQYNAPKHEQGLAPAPVRSDSVKPSMRYAVMERAGFRCEFCGADGSGRAMHIGHLLSEKEIRANGLPLNFADDPDNLAWLCDACNLGMSEHSMTIHNALRFLIQRNQAPKAA